jgi:hypothetical protein
MAPTKRVKASTVAADGGVGVELPGLAEGAAPTTVSFGLR